MEPVFDPARPIEAPTLLLTADPSSPDAAARPPHVQRFAASSPNVDVRVMHGACHLIHDELAQRDQFSNEVLAFLDRLDSAG
jgi:alpha-beta hydrolase superfamily lysophospholipase